jgi:hypothetical protein
MLIGVALSTVSAGSFSRVTTRSDRGAVLTALRSATSRRKLQLALGFIWLVDASLQYQPYMFGRAFVTETIEPAAAGTPYWVEHPSLWAAHFMIHHITFYNSLFATLQLLIALALFYRPAVKIGLAVSIVWALGIWWLAEGLGGITLGASPLMGAPGGAILYAFIAVLVWPRPDARHGTGPLRSVAETGPLGATLPKLIWAVLWLGFAALTLENVNRSPSALHDMVTGMSPGEPAWIKTIDRGLAAPLAHHGTEWSIALAVLFALVAVGVFRPRAVRPALILAILLGLVIWVAEDFGEIATGTATDVNSGPLLVLLAACFWPTRNTQRPRSLTPPASPAATAATNPAQTG